MSMILTIKRLTENSRQRVLNDPKELSLCFSITKPQTSKSLERDPCFDEPECDVNKAWDILCFLLCGEGCSGYNEEIPFPANFLLDRNDAIDEDMGYGPPWSFSPQDVKQIADFLDSQTEEQLRTRFVPSALHKANVYPSGWDSYDDENASNLVNEWEQWTFAIFEDMRKYVRTTADRDLALIFYLT